MCSALNCRISDTNSTCTSILGLGAAIGTPCDSGKVLKNQKFSFKQSNKELCHRFV